MDRIGEDKMTQKKSNEKASGLVKRVEYLERQDKYHKENMFVAAMFGFALLCLGMGIYIGVLIGTTL
jgi:hypothetical protein